MPPLKTTPKTYGSLNPLLNTPKVTTPAVSGVPVNQPTRPVATTPTVTAPVNTRQSQIDSITAQANAIKAQIPTATGLTPSTTYGNNLAVDSATSPLDTALMDEINRNRTIRDTAVSDEKIYRDKLKQYQGQIDAVNQIYREKINQSRIEGQGKLGTGRAIQGRSGLLGSDFAAAQNDTITQGNNDILSGIYGEQNAAIQTILGTARKDAQDEAAAKRAAKEAGSANYLKFLGEQETRKSGRLDNFIKSVGSTDLSTISPTNLAEVAKSYGISVDTLKSRVKEAQDAQKSAAAEADLKTRKSEADIAKIEADIASGKLITIGEGTTLYNTETGETFKNPKTYAPSSNGTGGAILPVGGATPFVGQANYNNLNAKQKTQADSLNNLVRSLNEYKTYYEANPGSFGGKFGNLVGADSGLLETKLNSIIFAAAQAEGTGALQAADRQVIEKIVPNPTSLSGAFNTATKGGKSANVTRIEDQIKKYTDNLAGFGLSPASLPGASNATTPSTQTLTSPDGKQEVNVSDLTPAELKEAKDAGWL